MDDINAFLKSLDIFNSKHSEWPQKRNGRMLWKKGTGCNAFSLGCRIYSRYWHYKHCGYPTTSEDCFGSGSLMKGTSVVEYVYAALMDVTMGNETPHSPILDDAFVVSFN